MRKISAAVAATIALAVALLFVATSQGGDSDRRMPVGGGDVTKTSPTELRLASARVIIPWRWNMWAVKRPSLTSIDRVCLFVDLLGPGGSFPGGFILGPEVGAKGCGPIDPSRGVVVALPTEGGSVELPSGKTESWKSFDVGAAAYLPSVDRVRLVFSNGGSELLKTRAVPDAVAFKGTEPFRYVVFAVHGCVSRVEGLEKGRTVARVGPRVCSGSSE